jgi:hypothetical protein
MSLAFVLNAACLACLLSLIVLNELQPPARQVVDVSYLMKRQQGKTFYRLGLNYLSWPGNCLCNLMDGNGVKDTSRWISREYGGNRFKAFAYAVV